MIITTLKLNQLLQKHTAQEAEQKKTRARNRSSRRRQLRQSRKMSDYDLIPNYLREYDMIHAVMEYDLKEQVKQGTARDSSG